MFQHHPARMQALEHIDVIRQRPVDGFGYHEPSCFLKEFDPKRSMNAKQKSMSIASNPFSQPKQPYNETFMDRLQAMDVLRRIPTQDRSIERVESILLAAAELCTETGAESLTTASVSEKLSVPIGTIYQFFENRHAILLGLAVRTNFMTDHVIRAELTRFQPDADWLSVAASTIDRSIDVFLEQDNLVRVIRALYHLEIYQEIHTQTIMNLVDTLMSYFSSMGVEPTPQRQEMAYFALRVGSHCQHMIILETDSRRREFMREQFKTLGANYLLQALIAGTDRT